MVRDSPSREHRRAGVGATAVRATAVRVDGGLCGPAHDGLALENLLEQGRPTLCGLAREHRRPGRFASRPHRACNNAQRVAALFWRSAFSVFDGRHARTRALLRDRLTLAVRIAGLRSDAMPNATDEARSAILLDGDQERGRDFLRHAIAPVVVESFLPHDRLWREVLLLAARRAMQRWADSDAVARACHAGRRMTEKHRAHVGSGPAFGSWQSFPDVRPRARPRPTVPTKFCLQQRHSLLQTLLDI